MLSYERAQSFEGAVAQLVFIARDAALIEDQISDRDVIRMCERLNRNLYSALAVLAAPSGVDPYLLDRLAPDCLDEIGRVGLLDQRLNGDDSPLAQLRAA